MNYKTICPKCNGHNFYVTEHNNKRYCFNCGYFENGDTTEIILKQSVHIDTIREIYTELTFYYHSCLDTPQIKYLHERGITDESIRRFMIGYCPDSSHILYAHPLIRETGIAINNKPFLGNRIVFPYWFGDQVTDIRGRAYDNSGEKYKTCYNGTYYRGAEFPYNANEEGDTLLITESEIKTILPSQFGIKTWGLPGINAKRIIVHKGKKILCFDNQIEHRRELIAAIKRWIKRIPDLLIATLPLRGRTKQDIDEYILNYGIDAFRIVINAAVPQRTWLQYNR